MRTKPYYMRAAAWLGILSLSVQAIAYHRLDHSLWKPFATDAAN